MSLFNSFSGTENIKTCNIKGDIKGIFLFLVYKKDVFICAADPVGLKFLGQWNPNTFQIKTK